MSKAAYQQLNVRLAPEIIRDLDEIARAEDLDKTTVVRRLIADGIRRWRLEYALKLYQEGRISKARAAEMAGVSLYEVMDAIRQRGLQAQYTLEEALEDMKDIAQRSLPS
ncbi:MAG: UPF0175 family protein [Anaerolineae bacterium]